MSTGPSGHLSMDSLVEMWKKMSMAGFFWDYHRALWHIVADRTEDAVLTRETLKATGRFPLLLNHMWSRRTVWSKKPWDWKNTKNSSHLFCSPNTRLAVLNCSSQLHSLKHSFPKLSDRTHRFSFLAVEAECLLNQLKPITFAVTTGDLNSLVFYSLQLLFTLLCVLSVFSYIN